MPELPEVETTRAGIEPHIIGHQIKAFHVRQPQLRWPIPTELATLLTGNRVQAVRRRAKYLLIDIAAGKSEDLLGTLIIHLGMSGSLRVINAKPYPDPKKHEHFDIEFDDCLVRFNDPRRFGACLWQAADEVDSRLQHLGPEPLSDTFNGDYIFAKSRGRSSAIKTFIMDQRIVVGVGNIYASESLFLAGINPKKAAGKVSKKKYQELVSAIKIVLDNAIAQGGTTLRDFTSSDGKAGYFAQELRVYGREGLGCIQCQQPIKQIVQGQRSTFYCTKCQR
ncbi:bifunctional DNA-formamidopyrimidine glycosylase/DNA-(apurinic or apyrimidinic site) lyase [Bermanella marisrubri]|uniref:Formamidopyrimidine-DNA glycosylase n=1 Tax=Bermanella marisrubri TaxID=207949 RepID=Q1N413_9GAMM|nr:bifunctional DNA-formamidopyrimidine glycosylase/DNA-(apurinic or apyrimidinic site) lyase [Bermanella marisrubri]EAT13052.1 formamidopyrimidine-DNA glycosylase [Oceanobacter sp. RED65] [Bermanella marisrubri]QIZ82829.1 bifunctional DNA-formamidopyrimidine glycosylase/DNA-(apurinic or apyrimidinic site) lyase [Bermanella marisrubri]